MTVSAVSTKDKDYFNQLAHHPLQSWEWGDFRIKTGIEVIRLGKYEANKLVEAIQMTIHPLPFIPFTIGYIPKSEIPSKEMFGKLTEIGKQYNCIFIKIEPNIEIDTKILGSDDTRIINDSRNILISQYPNIVPSPHPLFTKYTFSLDLTKSEEKLLEIMHHKTRYNIKIAQKHNVYIEEEFSMEAFNEYLKLTFETTKRQKFYAHNRKYHLLMWETMKQNNIAHLFSAKYKQNGQIYRLTTWIIFLFNKTIYYPYGASSDKFRNVMASNLLLWEIIRWGKKNGAKQFDMWGSLGPNPDPKDPWYGFHRFKQGYGPDLIEFLGSFDLIINPIIYKLYNLIYIGRQIFLDLKNRL